LPGGAKSGAAGDGLVCTDGGSASYRREK